MDLTTHYLGLSLRNPLVASASPLSVSLDRVVALADSGVGAIVLYSLFEEEVNREELRDVAIVETHEHAFGEAMSYFPTTARPRGAEASAVAAQWCARVRCTVATSRTVAPSPPSSRGTARARRPSERRIS